MDFELSELQTELAEGIGRLCQGSFGLEAVRAREGADQVVDRAGWRQLGQAGVFGLCLAEASGVGLGMAEAVVVFEELGRALVPGPLVGSHLAAGLIDGAESGTTVAGLLELPTGGSGVVPLVAEHLADVDVLLVLGPAGITAVDPSTVGATRLSRPMDPLTPVWTLDGPPDGEPVAGPEVADWWRRDGSVLTAALQVGLAGWATQLAVDYAKERHQFGRPIGTFQAVKHLCADMAVRTELARCAVQAAAVTIDQPDVGDGRAAAAGAKLLADQAAVANGRACIQVHGGMGFTWEVPAHLAFKRARVLATQFGTADQLAESLAATLADTLRNDSPSDDGARVFDPMSRT